MFRFSGPPLTEGVGEAINRLTKLDAATASRISQRRRIINFRNISIHGYDLVDTNVAWDVVQTDPPALLREVEVLLSEPEGQTCSAWGRDARDQGSAGP